MGVSFKLSRAKDTMSDNNMTPEENHQDSEVFRLRRQRLKELQSTGQDPYQQTRFDRTHLTSAIAEDFEALEGQEVRVAGRLKARRGQGKIGFADLWDDGGKIQLIGQIDRL